MARRKHGEDTGEWPGGEEENNEEGAKPEVTATPSTRPKEVTYLTPQGFQTASTDPVDLGDYEGEYKMLSNGETFGLKVVEDDPQGRTHHLKNVEHFWAGTAEEFRQVFEKQ
jgi:hypothetical protein